MAAMTHSQAESEISTPEPEAGGFSRILPLQGCRNARDVGGYAAADGTSTVRWRMLLRSEKLNHLTDGDRDVLADLDLRTVIDLRTAHEIGDRPDRLDGLGVDRFHIPPLLDLTADLPSDLADLYVYMVDESGDAIAAAVRQLAQPGALPALVHCTAGKDRTGLLIAMVLDLVGIDEAVIVEDYVLSNASLGLVGTGVDEPMLYHRVYEEWLVNALAHLRARYGSTADYLKAHGVGDATIAALRSSLLDAA